MAVNRYHGADMTASIQTEAGTSISIASFRDVEVIASVEVDYLYSGDSIHWEEAKQREGAVNVLVGIAAWDTALLQQWLGGSGAASTGWVDTSDPAEFQVTGEVTPHGSNTNLKAVVERVVFPEMTMFSATMDEWVQNDVEGTGRKITELSGP